MSEIIIGENYKLKQDINNHKRGDVMLCRNIKKDVFKYDGGSVVMRGSKSVFNVTYNEFHNYFEV